MQSMKKSTSTVFLRLKVSTVEAETYNKYDLEMVDSDLGSWEQGDKLVIASTDYDYEQAEEVEVEAVAGNVVQVKGIVCPCCSKNQMNSLLECLPHNSQAN